MPSDSSDDAKALTVWIDDVERHWLKLGVSSADSQRLRFELESDLTDALAAGAPLASLIADKPRDFAEHVATANEIPIGKSAPVMVTRKSLVVTGLGGGLLGASIAWIFLYPMVLSLPQLGDMSNPLVALLTNIVAGAVVLLCSMAAMLWRFRADTTIRRTVTFAAPLIVLAGIVAIAPTMAFASLANFSSNPLVLLSEAAIVGGFVAVAIIQARRLATRPKSVRTT